MVAIAGQMQVVLTQSTPKTALEYDLRTATRHALNVLLPGHAVPEASVEPPIFGSTVDVGVVAAQDQSEEPSWDALIELKWWYDPSNQLDDSITDVVKLATYRMLGVARTAYLLSAGSGTTWADQSGYRYYTRLWDDGSHDLLGLIAARSPYAADRFKPPKRYPPRAPRTIVTTRVAEVPIQLVAAPPWMLRCSRVDPGDDGVLHSFE